MRRYYVALGCTVLLLCSSPVSAGVEITSTFGGVTLDLEAYNATEFDHTRVSTGNSFSIAAVPGALVGGRGRISTDGIQQAGESTTIRAAGLLEVLGVVYKPSAGIIAWDVPPNAWLILDIATTSPYQYHFTGSVHHIGRSSLFGGTSLDFREGGYFGPSMTASGQLSPGEYSLIFETQFELFTEEKGIYHARQDWDMELALAPASSHVPIPEHASLLVWAIGLATVPAFAVAKRRRTPR